MSEVVLDPERQKKAKAYARINRRLMLVDMLLGAAYTLAWLSFGWSAWLEQFLNTFTQNEWLLIAVYITIFGGVLYLIDLPLSYYSGYTLPHRYGLSHQTLPGWVGDQMKTALLGGILGIFVLEIIYAVLRAFPDTWWLWAAGFILLFNILLTNLAPQLIFPIFNKYEPLSENHADLVDRLMNLAVRAKTSVRGVYQFDMSRRTSQANAALAGLGNTRRILLGDTLISEFSDDEIETVMAHELGHHAHRDLPIGILVESALTLVGFYLAGVGLERGAEALNFQGPADIAAFPLLIVVMGVFGLITMPLINAFSRWRERRADEYALRLTDKNTAFATALTRLANQNLADADPEAWVEFLFYSHPALSKRIRMAETWQSSGD